MLAEVAVVETKIEELHVICHWNNVCVGGWVWMCEWVGEWVGGCVGGVCGWF